MLHTPAPEARGVALHTFFIAVYRTAVPSVLRSARTKGLRAAVMFAALLAIAAVYAPVAADASEPVTLQPVTLQPVTLQKVKLQLVDGSAKPTFSLTDSTGQPIDLATHRGRPVLVHFFATWCEPCREELPALNRMVERAGPNGITVLAISVAEVDLRVRRFLETTPVSFPVLLDRDRAVSKAWRVHTLPTTYVLDATLTPRLLVERDFAWDTIHIDELNQQLSKAAQRNDAAPAPSTATAHTGG